jgi:hypothetical protein
MNRQLELIELLLREIVLKHPVSILVGFLLGSMLYNVFCIDRCIRLDSNHKISKESTNIIVRNQATMYTHIVYAFLFFGLTLITTVIAF